MKCMQVNCRVHLVEAHVDFLPCQCFRNSSENSGVGVKYGGGVY